MDIGSNNTIIVSLISLIGTIIAIIGSTVIGILSYKANRKKAESDERTAAAAASDEISVGAATLLIEYRLELQKSNNKIDELELELEIYKKETDQKIREMETNHKNEIAEMIRTHGREIAILETKLDESLRANIAKSRENAELIKRIEKLEKRDTGPLKS